MLLSTVSQTTMEDFPPLIQELMQEILWYTSRSKWVSLVIVLSKILPLESLLTRSQAIATIIAT